MHETSKIYLYCIIDAVAINDQLKLKGFDNNPVYCIPYKDISAVASDFTCMNTDIKKCAQEHETVIESLMNNHTVLPMRLQTVFSTHENVLSSVAKHYTEFIDNIARLSGKCEYGIKVLWLVEKIKEEIVSNENEISSTPIQGDTPASRYLKEKYSKYKADKALKEKADVLVSEIDRLISELASEKKMQILQTEKLLLNASYLVDISKKAKIPALFKMIKSNFRELEFSFSGPWPAYNFVKMKG